MSMGLSMLATALSLLLAAGILDAAPYQELQPRAGYVPVYIREGETPLSEIHPGLAEAFKEPSYGSNSDIFPGLSSSDESSSNDQSIPEELGDAPAEIPDEPTIIMDTSSEEANKKNNDEETKESKVSVAEAAKEAIKELVSVFETEMLEKLGLSEDNKESKSEDKSIPEEIPIENLKTDESKSSAKDGESSEKSSTSDVLTVEAFKAKDFNKDLIREDGIDVPEDVPLDQ